MTVDVFFFFFRVGGCSMIILPATDVCAWRAANIKEAAAASQLTEWKVSLAMPVLRLKVVLWCFPQLSSAAAPWLLLRARWGGYTSPLGSPCLLWWEIPNTVHSLENQSWWEYRQRLSGKDPLTPCNPPYLFSKDHMKLFHEENGSSFEKNNQKCFL